MPRTTKDGEPPRRKADEGAVTSSSPVRRLFLPRRQGRLLSGGPDDASDFFTQTNLVSNTPDIPAVHHDPHLQNAWGISFGPTTPFWISDNGAGVATLYDGNGVQQPPPPAAQRVVAM